MLWDTWALLSILGLCLTVIVWAVWGFYRDSRPGGDVRSLLLPPLETGRHLAVPASGGAGRWHRGRHRAA